MQLSNVLTGFLTGLPALIAVGPIALLLIELGLERGVRGGYPAALGVAAGDTAFAVVAAVAGTALSALLSPVETWLRGVAGLVLVGVAVHLALTGRRHATPGDGAAGQGPTGPTGPTGATAVVEAPAARGVARTRLAGGFLGLTIVNPLTIVVYAGIVVSGGAGVGTLGWVLGMALASLAVHGGFVGLGHVLGATVPGGAVAGLRLAGAAFLVLLAVHLVLG
jgi:threonine/homoserine/homoserine lactone efflux protein